jgi:single-stranded-DNA-specific exonuclease
LEALPPNLHHLLKKVDENFYVRRCRKRIGDMVGVLCDIDKVDIAKNKSFCRAFFKKRVGCGATPHGFRPTVLRRINMSIWIKNEKQNEESVRKMQAYFKAKGFDMSVLLAHAVLNRGFNTPKSALEYLSRDVRFMYDKKLTDMIGVVSALGIISSAITSGRKIWIYGDYDVDGVMSSSILYKGFKGLGGNVAYYIPDRVEDGYGLNTRAIGYINEQGCDVLVTCDNGIASVKEIDYAKQLGMVVVVLDHHEPPVIDGTEVIPNADAVVDAKISTSNYRFREMCAGGLCYRFIVELYSYMNRKLTNEKELITLASIATVCDVVPLVEENRLIAFAGLSEINTRITNVGLKALVRLTEVNKDGRRITESDYGFRIGPCINASGRLEQAAEAVELFVTEDEARAEKIAEKLMWLNSERKKLTEDGMELVDSTIEDIDNTSVIVAYSGDIHESIAGIVAGRIKEKYNRPTIVLTDSHGLAKGSGRSIEEYNMFEELSKCRHIMEKFGGHSMAAGMSLKKENVGELRRLLNKNSSLTKEDLIKKYKYDTVVDLRDITVASVDGLSVMSPFGTANSEPLYVAEGVTLSGMRVLGEKRNVVVANATQNRATARCIGFGDEAVAMMEELFDGEYTITADILFKADINEYMGNRSVQLRIIDAKK